MDTYDFRDNTAKWLDDNDYRMVIPAARPYPAAQKNTSPIRQEVLTGTAVPKTPEVLPEREAPGRRKSAPERPRRQRSARQSSGQAAVRRNREKLSTIGLPYLIFLVAVTALLMISCVNMLTVRSRVTASKKRIERYERQLQTLKSDNDALEVFMSKSVDLDAIYKTATEELGMVYPSDDQVITYTRTEKGYVRQYEDIPTE